MSEIDGFGGEIYAGRIMKLRLLSCVLSFLLGGSLVQAQSSSNLEFQKLTAQRDRAVAAIDRNYQASLEKLLQQALSRQDAETAATIEQTLARLTNSPDKAASGAPVSTKRVAGSPTGLWHWFTGSIVIIRPDGTAQGDAVKGTWEWDNRAKRSFHITWERFGVNSLVMSAGGMELQGIDKQRKFTATRLTPAEAAAWEKSGGKAPAETSGDLFGVPGHPSN